VIARHGEADSVPPPHGPRGRAARVA
jgi:hypothetical protein